MASKASDSPVLYTMTDNRKNKRKNRGKLAKRTFRSFVNLKIRKTKFKAKELDLQGGKTEPQPGIPIP